MTQEPERRRVRRAAATGRLTGQASLTVEFRLLDLSPTGARIEHLGVLRPGTRCAIQLPAPSGSLAITAQIVWTSVVDREQKPEEEQFLRYHSGLMFGVLSPEQKRALASLLERLHPEVD